jgi:hypothetical protein
MRSILKDHPMTSIFVIYTLKSIWWITGLPSIEKSFISCIDLSWLSFFSGEWWSERAWSRLCASFKLKTSELSWGDAKSIWHVLWSNPQLPWYDVNLIYFIIFVCRKPLPADPSKKNYSTHTFSICYPGRSFCRSNWFHCAVCCWGLGLLSADSWILGGLEEQRRWSTG